MDFISKSQLGIAFDRIKTWINANFAPKNGSHSNDFAANTLNVGPSASGTPSITFSHGTVSSHTTVLKDSASSANRTITLPDNTGTVALTSDLDGKANKNGSASENFSANALTATSLSAGSLTLDGNDASIYKKHTSLATTYTYALPNKNGTVALTSDLSGKADKNGSISEYFQASDIRIPSTNYGTVILDSTTTPGGNTITVHLPTQAGTLARVEDLAIANRYTVVSSLPTASADTMAYIYLVPSSNPKTQNAKDEFITIDNGSGASPRYTWEQIGSTETDLSGYWAKTELTEATLGSASDTASTAANASLYAMLNYYFPVS